MFSNVSPVSSLQASSRMLTPTPDMSPLTTWLGRKLLKLRILNLNERMHRIAVKDRPIEIATVRVGKNTVLSCVVIFVAIFTTSGAVKRSVQIRSAGKDFLRVNIVTAPQIRDPVVDKSVIDARTPKLVTLFVVAPMEMMNAS